MITARFIRNTRNKDNKSLMHYCNKALARACLDPQVQELHIGIENRAYDDIVITKHILEGLEFDVKIEGTILIVKW